MIITDNNHIDKARFSDALDTYRSSKNTDSGNSIGTLGEKSLHAVLKRYYEPDSSRHEVAVGDYVADIVGEEGIIEIQTRNFSRLKPKLGGLLELCRVTVVHPVIVSRRIINIDGLTGEVVSVRTSPKHGSLYTGMRELYTLRDILTSDNLTMKFPLLTADEFRTYGVKTRRRKKQRTKRGEYVSDVIPTDIIDEITLSESCDYSVLIPDGLPEQFGAKEFAAAAATDAANARMAINLLVRMKLAKPVDKKGNRIVYTLVAPI